MARKLSAEQRAAGFATTEDVARDLLARAGGNVARASRAARNLAVDAKGAKALIAEISKASREGETP